MPEEKSGLRGSLAAALWLAAALPASALVVSLDVKDPSTLHPVKQFAYRNHIVCQQIFDGLVRFDPDANIIPALAVSWERLGPLKMRFKLRRGVRFHDGEVFDAESVRFTLERYLDPKSGFPARGFLSPIERVEVVDPYTVDIVTSRPDGLLLNRLAGFVLILPPRRLKRDGDEAFAKKPVGTGAFVFSFWTPGKEIALRKNRSYWMEGYPKSEELSFRFIPMGKNTEALLRGDVDMIWEVPGSRTLEIERNPGTRVVKGDTFFTVFAGLSHSSGPLTDVRVRRALNYGVDRRALIRYDLLGNGRLLAASSMPKEGGHDSSLKVYPYDPERASKLLCEAGYCGGLKLSAIVNVNAERTARIIAAHWKRIGVKLEMEVVAESEFSRFAQRHFDVSIGGSPDPMAHSYFIQSIILYSRSPFAIAGDPAYDKVLETMAGTIDEDERDRMAEELDRFIYDNFYGVPTYQRVQTYGVREGLAFDHYVTGMPYFHAAHLEENHENGKKSFIRRSRWPTLRSRRSKDLNFGLCPNLCLASTSPPSM